MRTCVLVLLVVCVLGPVGLCPVVQGDGTATRPKPLAPARTDAIEALVGPWVASEHLVGVAIGVIDGDRQGTFGFGRLAYGGERVPDEDTVFEIGSISKVFTGTLLAHAVEDGAVKLDDPVQAHLPDGVTMPIKGDAPITLRHLSTHSSGLPRMPTNFAPKNGNDPYTDYDADLLFAFLEGVVLERAPDEANEYSNFAVGLLGHLLGAKAGGYEALLAAKITEPLGMTSTSLALSADQSKRFASAYTGDTSDSHAWTFDALAGAGAIRSTVSDMLCFARAHLEPDAATPLGRAIRKATTMQRPDAGKASGMGLGWIIAPDGHRWHNGQTGGYHSFIGMDLEHDRAVVVLSNTGSGVVDRIGNDVLRLLAGHDVDPPEVTPLPVVESDVLERYVGTYALSPVLKLDVSRDGRRLFVQATNQVRLRVFPTSDTGFAYRAVEARLVFEVEGDDPAKSVVLHQGGMEMRAVRE